MARKVRNASSRKPPRSALLAAGPEPPPVPEPPPTLNVWAWCAAPASSQACRYFLSTWEENLARSRLAKHLGVAVHIRVLHLGNFEEYLGAPGVGLGKGASEGGTPASGALPSSFWALGKELDAGDAATFQSDAVRLAVLRKYGGLCMELSTLIDRASGERLLNLWQCICSDGFQYERAVIADNVGFVLSNKGGAQCLEVNQSQTSPDVRLADFRSVQSSSLMALPEDTYIATVQRLHCAALESADFRRALREGSFVRFRGRPAFSNYHDPTFRAERAAHLQHLPLADGDVTGVRVHGAGLEQWLPRREQRLRLVKDCIRVEWEIKKGRMRICAPLFLNTIMSLVMAAALRAGKSHLDLLQTTAKLFFFSTAFVEADWVSRAAVLNKFPRTAEFGTDWGEQREVFLKALSGQMRCPPYPPEILGGVRLVDAARAMLGLREAIAQGLMGPEQLKGLPLLSAPVLFEEMWRLCRGSNIEVAPGTDSGAGPRRRIMRFRRRERESLPLRTSTPAPEKEAALLPLGTSPAAAAPGLHIDLITLSKAGTGQILLEALKRDGYAFVRIPGLGAARAACLNASTSFFGLPAEQKRRHRVAPSATLRHAGYLDFGNDLQAFEVPLRLNGGFAWPPDGELQRAARRAIGLLFSASKAALAAVALAAGLDSAAITAMLDLAASSEAGRSAGSSLRLCQYDAPATESAITQPWHTDGTLLTLAPAGTAARLVCRHASDGSPITPEASMMPDEALMFAGDVLSFLTGGAIPACMHAVLPPPAAGRASMPFFLRPGRNVTLRPPASCAGVQSITMAQLERMENERGIRQGWPWKQSTYYTDRAPP